MKKILSLTMAVALLVLSLLTMTACGKVEGKTYVFSHAKCTWDDDATDEQKTNIVTTVKFLTGDDSITVKTVLDKLEAFLEEANKDRSYRFDEGGTLGDTLTGTWQQTDDGVEVKIMGISTELEMEWSNLVEDIDDYAAVDVKLVFKKK